MPRGKDHPGGLSGGSKASVSAQDTPFEFTVSTQTDREALLVDITAEQGQDGVAQHNQVFGSVLICTNPRTGGLHFTTKEDWDSDASCLQDAGIGFILVIDRRLDKWTSVKASVLRIAASFPGNLQLVLVLRPTGFLHRTLSDIALKFNKDEFKMKVPIIMLSSATELQSYIEKTQLTEDLGGALDYCHTRWLSHRTAIESFALMVKQTAQMLQSFGTELAETELPNDVQSTYSLLATHSEKKNGMKDDLRLALKQGHAILESIREPIIKNSDYQLNQDQLDNKTTVERLQGIKRM